MASRLEMQVRQLSVFVKPMATHAFAVPVLWNVRREGSEFAVILTDIVQSRSAQLAGIWNSRPALCTEGGGRREGGIDRVIKPLK